MVDKANQSANHPSASVTAVPAAAGTVSEGLEPEDKEFTRSKAATQTPTGNTEPKPAEAGENKPRPKEPRPAEHGGPAGLEPTRYGDWEKNGRCTDF